MPPKPKWINLTNHAPPPLRSYTREEDWSEYKETILEWRKRKVKLSNIRSRLISRGFKATEAQYKERLRQWGDKKYLSRKQRQYIRQQVTKRGGRIPIFKNSIGNTIPEQRIRDVVKRNDGDGVFPVDVVLSPNGLILMSPALSPHPAPAGSTPIHEAHIVDLGRTVRPPTPSPTSAPAISTMIQEKDGQDWEQIMDSIVANDVIYTETPPSESMVLVSYTSPACSPLIDPIDRQSFSWSTQSLVETAEIMLEIFGITLGYEYSSERDDADPKAIIRMSHSSEPKQGIFEWKDKLEGILLSFTGAAKASQGKERAVIYEIGSDADNNLDNGDTNNDNTEGNYNKVNGSEKGYSKLDHIEKGETDTEIEREATDGGGEASSDDKYNTSPNEAISMYLAAFNEYQKINFSGAMQILSLSPLEDLSSRIGSKNMWYLKCHQLLGIIFLERDRYDDAIEILQDLANKSETLLGARHEFTRNTYYSLSIAHHWNSNSDNIWEFLGKAICYHNSSSNNNRPSGDSPDHPADQLRSFLSPEIRITDEVTFRSLLQAIYLHRLEFDFRSSRQIALALFKRRRVLDDDLQPWVPWSLCNLSGNLLELGLLDQASSLLAELTMLLEKKPCLDLGDRKSLSLTVKCQHDRVRFLRGEDTSDINQVEGLLIDDLSSWESAYPQETIQTANLVTTLASLFRKKKDYTKSIAFYERGIRMRRQHLDNDRPEVMTALNDIVSVLNERGLVLYAKPLAHYVLKSADRTYGPMHPKVLEAIEKVNGITAKAAGWEVIEA